MEHSEETTQGSAAFGAYLKKVREGRRLSLDAVEELSAAFPEKVTKSHLSRIENGLAFPTFPRLMAMSHIYGVPIASLAERYEVELRRGMRPVDLGGRSDDEVLQQVDALIRAGDMAEALPSAWALFERRNESAFGAPFVDPKSFEVRVRIIACMNLSGRYEYAKGLVEETFGAKGVQEPQRLVLLQLLATTSYRLRRYTIALLAIEECERASTRDDVATRFLPDVLALKANLLLAMGQQTEAIALYREAADRYRGIGNDYESASTRINLAEALGEAGSTEEARQVLVSVLTDMEAGSFERLRAIALCVSSKIEYRTGNLDEADRLAVKSNLIARRIEHPALVFKNCFYLWRIAQARGDQAAMRLNERTLRSYLGRIEGGDAEVEEFRGTLTRAES